MNRPSIDATWLQVAKVLSQRATCPRRKVGCVITDIDNFVLATGFNGVPKGVPHCIDVDCGGAKYKSGEGLESCVAMHGEANALLRCTDVTRIHTVYCTTASCIHCTKMIMNTSCKRIVFIEDYPHSEVCRKMVESVGIIWEKFNDK